MNSEVKVLETSDIAKFYELGIKYQQANEAVSDFIKKYKFTANERSMTVLNEETKELIEVSERDIWDEVFYVGWETSEHRAVQALKNKYPELFELLEEDKKLAKEFSDYQIKTFGFSLQKMTAIDVFNLTSMICRYQVELMKKNGEF